MLAPFLGFSPFIEGVLPPRHLSRHVKSMGNHILPIFPFSSLSHHATYTTPTSCQRTFDKNKKGPYDGLIVVMCGHGTMGQFVASDDPGYTEKREEKHKRLPLGDLKAMWNSKNARKLGPFPKIFIKAACRGALKGDSVQLRYPERGGAKKWAHPFAEMVSIYASMPGESSRDSSGEAMGCYLVSTLNTILRNPKWRLETLESICLRMRRGIGDETCAKEWVDVEHSHSKPILLRRRTDTSNLLIPPQFRVQFFFEFYCHIATRTVNILHT